MLRLAGFCGIVAFLIMTQVSACTSFLPPKGASGPMIQAQTAAVSTSSAVTVDKTGIDPLTGTYGNYNLGIVKIQEGIVSGDGCYDNSGNIIVLISNKNATDPTYAQLVQYLNSDTTDEYPYISTGNIQGTICGSAESLVNLVHIQKIIDGTARPTAPDVCADFAERLHNDAEMAGIKCAFVTIDTSTGFHALNAFQTTDEGLVFIDDTGIVSNTSPTDASASRCVKKVDVNVGTPYIPVSLFPSPDRCSTWCSMGVVISCQMTWDGNWNN